MTLRVVVVGGLALGDIDEENIDFCFRFGGTFVLPVVRKAARTGGLARVLVTFGDVAACSRLG